jgi:hypothetical protein
MKILTLAYIQVSILELVLTPLSQSANKDAQLLAITSYNGSIANLK